ncbi:MAG: CsbD family protein [Gemmatimonadales bacterium]|nr:CsbD family protein [Gemmatimonadales bacterium]
MNWDIVAGNWKQFKGKVKARWGNLTDDHLDVIAGRRVELSGKIQEAYGITKDEAERQIRRFEKGNKDRLPKAPS